ncbi:hypothetical protein HID58_033721, partial [Brassica napus]
WLIWLWWDHFPLTHSCLDFSLVLGRLFLLYISLEPERAFTDFVLCSFMTLTNLNRIGGFQRRRTYPSPELSQITPQK